MTDDIISFDPIWEEKYGNGHNEKAPWDQVVSFIFRFYRLSARVYTARARFYGMRIC